MSIAHRISGGIRLVQPHLILAAVATAGAGCLTSLDVPVGGLISCTTDADCICPGCQPNEICLTESHCSETFTVPCDGDSDCEEPACPICNDNETCTRVLAVPELIVLPGQAVDLVDEAVVLKNQIGDPVPRRVVDQQAPEHRLLGFDRVWRRADGRELRVEGLVHGTGTAKRETEGRSHTIQAGRAPIRAASYPVKRRPAPIKTAAAWAAVASSRPLTAVRPARRRR